MLDSIFIAINQTFSQSTVIAAAGCFAWGMISVLLSPCHMASIPLIIAYVSGQERVLKPREAGFYAVLFGAGLFITIAVVGFVCALAGRMLGDIGGYWPVLIGAILIWVSLGMFGVDACTFSGSLFYRVNLKGLFGAFVLGLLYGMASGSCTFGFIAPILAIITVQQKIATGILFILLFAAGHCLPIVVAGSSAAAVRRLSENHAWQGAGAWFRQGAALMIGLLGGYFIISPFVG